MPAAAVIPSPIAYIKVVAVKKRSKAFGPPREALGWAVRKPLAPPKVLERVRSEVFEIANSLERARSKVFALSNTLEVPVPKYLRVQIL